MYGFVKASISRPSLVFAILVAIAALPAIPVQAQTFTLLHTFTGGADGSFPQTGTVDAAGNFYGTAAEGGQRSENCQVLQCGLAFKLSQVHSSWVLSPIYSFTGGADGWMPNPGLIFGPDGALYGTTIYGGTEDRSPYCEGCGTVYKLQPPPTRCSSTLCAWRETILHSFPANNDDGVEPSGGVAFDATGKMYGVTYAGGSPCPQLGCGTVYQLTPANGSWSESVLYQFPGGGFGGEPLAPVALDSAGNIYGAEQLGAHYGAAYELSPSGSGWSYTAVYRFLDGSVAAFPTGVLLYAGNLYGTTLSGGSGGGGIVYELSPASGQLTTLQSFPYEGSEPFMTQAPMVADAQGNLYGASLSGGQYAQGSVFKLTPSGSGWIYTSLYDFTGGSDGAGPESVVLDSQGNLYGTARGGLYSQGVAFKITQ